MAFTVNSMRGDIRFFLGNLPTTTISDSDMDIIIQASVDRYSLEDADYCIVKYEATVEILRWILRNQAGDNLDGGVSRIREKIGKREKELEFSSDPKRAAGYQGVLDDLLADPTLIGCDPYADIADPDSQGKVIIGGVSQKQYDKVVNNPDRRSGLNSPTNNSFGFGMFNRFKY